MSTHSTIEWTDASWNPVRGCDKVSPGCEHCYAETFAERFRGVPGHPYERGFDLQLRPERLEQPLAWTRSRIIFVNSMSDLFHESIPVEYIARVGDVEELLTGHELDSSQLVQTVLTDEATEAAGDHAAEGFGFGDDMVSSDEVVVRDDQPILP